MMTNKLLLLMVRFATKNEQRNQFSIQKASISYSCNSYDTKIKQHLQPNFLPACKGTLE